MKHYRYSWDEMRVGVNFLDARIRESGKAYSKILALSRGGLVPGVMLSHSLNIPLHPIEWSFRDSNTQNEQQVSAIMNWIDSEKPLLIVDDICDSGKTLKSLLAFLNRGYFWFKGFDTAVLIHNKAQDHAPTFSSKIIDRSHDDRWVIFPWESKVSNNA